MLYKLYSKCWVECVGKEWHNDRSGARGATTMIDQMFASFTTAFSWMFILYIPFPEECFNMIVLF